MGAGYLFAIGKPAKLGLYVLVFEISLWTHQSKRTNFTTVFIIPTNFTTVFIIPSGLRQS